MRKNGVVDLIIKCFFCFFSEFMSYIQQKKDFMNFVSPQLLDIHCVAVNTSKVHCFHAVRRESGGMLGMRDDGFTPCSCVMDGGV